MNYYNPYFMPNSMMGATRGGLFSRLFGGLSFSRILDGTQRALNFANQAIPFVKQVRPMIGNAKTMFKVMSEFKRTEKPKQTNKAFRENKTDDTIRQNNYVSNNGPTFFM